MQETGRFKNANNWAGVRRAADPLSEEILVS